MNEVKSDKTVQWVKTLDAKLDDLRSNSGTHMVDGENGLLQVAL